MTAAGGGSAAGSGRKRVLVAMGTLAASMEECAAILQNFNVTLSNLPISSAHFHASSCN